MMAQLVGLVSTLQGEVQSLRAEVAAGVSAAPAEQVHQTPDTVRGKIKLPYPKTFSGSSQPGAVENFLFDCELYFRGMHTPG